MPHRFVKFSLVLILLYPVATTFADLESDFRQAYRSYNQYLEADDVPLALGAAADAYRLGSKLYGRKHVTTAKLAINYSSLLNDTRDYKEAAKVLKGKLKVMEKAYGEDAHDVVSLLVELGRAHFDPGKPDRGLEYFQRASAILANHDNPIVTGTRNFDIATILLKRRANMQTRPFVEAAYAAFADSLEENDVRLGLVNYHMALFATSDDRLIDSVAHLNHALTAFKTDNDQMGNLERTVRVMLVSALERSEQSELATEHCLAVGQRQEWRLPARPLYLKPPNFSKEKVEISLDNKKEKEQLAGRITISFSVDENGFVRSPRVASSTALGLNEAALEAISDFRYAPRFVDGSPVATSGVDFPMSYDFSQQTVKKNRFSIPPLRSSKTGVPLSGGTIDEFGGGGGGGK